LSSGAIDPVLLRLVALEKKNGKPLDHARSAFPSVSDEDLVLQAEAGSRGAVTLLFDRYSAQIFNVGLRILRDRGEAEDLVQEVFLGLLHKVKGFDPEKGCGRTWILQIAYRRAFDRRDYLTRRSFYNGADADQLKNVLTNSSKLEEQVANSVTTEQLRSTFAALSKNQRRTLQLFFFDGLTLREISERTGESLENARHFYYRGLERLRNSVANGNRK
jgi:RNA polymerase sigma-70 factor (ECF subfamily)